MGNEGRTDPQTLPSNPLCVPGALVASKILAWPSASPVLQCTEISCSPMGPVCTPGCPLYLQQGWWDLKVAVKRRGLGMPKELDPFLSDLEVHFQPTSDGQNVLLVSQLASFRDRSFSQVRCPCSAPRSMVLPGTAEIQTQGAHPCSVAGVPHHLLRAEPLPPFRNPHILTLAHPGTNLASPSHHHHHAGF